MHTIEAATKAAVAMHDVRVPRATGADLRSGITVEMRRVLAADVARWANLVKEKHVTFEQ